MGNDRDLRDQRRAEALRANLRRRKEKSRGEAVGGPGEGGGRAGEGQDASETLKPDGESA